MNFAGVAQGINQGIQDQQNQAKQQQQMAYQQQLMQLQSLALQKAQKAEVDDESDARMNATIAGGVNSSTPPVPGNNQNIPNFPVSGNSGNSGNTPSPGQPSVPMVQANNVTTPLPNQNPTAFMGSNLPPPQPNGGGGAPLPVPGSPMPTPMNGQQISLPKPTMPPYQVRGAAPSTQTLLPPQQSGGGRVTPPSGPPPIQNAEEQTPEQAKMQASEEVLKLANSPDGYTQMVQILRANGNSDEAIGRFLARSPFAQKRMAQLDEERKEALALHKEALDEGQRAYMNVLAKARDIQNAKNEDENRALRKEEIGVQREKMNKSSEGAGEKLTPEGLKVAAELMRSGKSIPGGWSAKGMSRGNAILNEMGASEQGGAGSGSVVGQQAKYKANSAALTQNTKDIAAIMPFKEMLDTNVDVAIDLGKKISSSNSALANKSINWIKKNAGDNPDTQEYLAQIAIVQTEAARVLNTPRLVGQLTDSARHEMQELVDGNTPINSAERVLNRMKKDGDNRVNSLLKEGKKLESDTGGGSAQSAKPTVSNW